MRILFVDSPNRRCGIREYGTMLLDAVMQYSIVEDKPFFLFHQDTSGDIATVEELFSTTSYDLIHINHQAGVMAHWTEEAVRKLICRFGVPVLVTVHDTFETREIMEERGLPHFATSASRVVVHESVEGLTGGLTGGVLINHPVWIPQYLGYGVGRVVDTLPRTVGSFGFDFPWKGFDMLHRAAMNARWKPIILKTTPGTWLPRQFLYRALANCSATAFLYQTGNSGTSGAIRLGIGAGHPVIALRGCRQFRDLEFFHGQDAICWAHDEKHVVEWLRSLQDPAVWEDYSTRVQALADRDSWINAAKKYYAIYEHLALGV